MRLAALWSTPWSRALATSTALLGCQVDAPGQTATRVAETSTIPPATRDPEPPPPVAPSPEPAAAPELAPRTPIGYRVAKPITMVHAAPSRRAEKRGRIESRKPFAIYGLTPGPDCAGEGWAEVDAGGFACLERASVSPGPARIQPELAEGRVLPFIYAKPRLLDRKTEAIAKVPRYLDRFALARGDAPLDHLQPDRQYAFERTKLRAAGLMLIDVEGRAVPSRDLKIARESDFAGRDLERAPIPDGVHAAWSVSRPAPLRERPERGARQVGAVAYHATLHIDPRPIPRAEELWYAVPDGAGPGTPAYVLSEDVNHWIPGARLPEAGATRTWIDVELGQQTLAVMRGETPLFVTLISSGAGGSATPLGLFRIYEKLAIWTMRSGPNAEDPYFVEGVPWIQYFHRRYAFHAAYWHDDFGKRRSHGCINLSPRDAAYIYSLTTPEVPPGWVSLYEHAGDAGTLVRVRRGTDPVPDLRLPLGVIEADEEGAQDPDPGALEGDLESKR